MNFIKSNGPEVDLMALQTDPYCGIILYADKDTCAILTKDNEAVIRSEEAPGYVVWTYVSLAHPDLVEDDDQTFEIDGVKYGYSAAEISDVTPVDQSDLSNSPYIDGSSPSDYPSYEQMHADWTNPNSQKVKDLIASITGFSPA